jgi:hypothetical protein
MPTTRACPECGATLAGDIPAGACPVCAFRGALALSGAEAQVEVTVSEKPGDQIGRYKLLEKIGEGGYGVVYMAEQTEPIRRRVALKVIKLGMDTKQVIARFEAERQALALMDHPNIAKVLDAGATETGRPYFVMELVRGIRITDYCDQNHFPPKSGWTCSCRSATPCSTPTRRASSTGTSSPRTSWSPSARRRARAQGD